MENLSAILLVVSKIPQGVQRRESNPVLTVLKAFSGYATPPTSHAKLVLFRPPLYIPQCQRVLGLKPSLLICPKDSKNCSVLTTRLNLSNKIIIKLFVFRLPLFLSCTVTTYMY
jgi:hypothetical protein